MSTKFIVTSAGEAIANLKLHFKAEPIASGSNPERDERYWYVKRKRVVMKPTGTQTSNGTKQYLVTVE
ncbi:hypothetical protein [Vibrio furnissii]|uniref:hypothetical protein n=1 Tax=Vibrio furnissii TaxID=29494 RepID=UPI001EEB562D|nr:hypothetical protein [Vibrio furnissii]MCG6268290.1 hypothetical protein [Vibrio furnissii]